MSIPALRRLVPSLSRSFGTSHTTFAPYVKRTPVSTTPITRNPSAPASTAAPQVTTIPDEEPPSFDDFDPSDIPSPAQSRSFANSNSNSQTEVYAPLSAAPTPPANFPNDQYTSTFQGTIPGEQEGPDWKTSFAGLSDSPFDRETAKILLKPLDPIDVEIKPGES
jgi:hypothetical protein